MERKRNGITIISTHAPMQGATTADVPDFTICPISTHAPMRSATATYCITTHTSLQDVTDKTEGTFPT